ncbi:uncharacterized protein F4822DRAFT_400286, partial [Hypoxylon trugodes]|uniref:uncharacterized protein n=1 Tax=Hypoxylon trugodes TaxID=326681 RepID=UPI00219A8779
MAPPPATPTPHRFLVPKRSQPRNETPKAFQSGAQQFQATPRFSHHSTPRGTAGTASSHHPPSSFVTPAPTRTGAGPFYRPTPRNTDPIHDIVDSSPPLTEEQTGDDNNRHDAIEFYDIDSNVDAVPESSPVRQGSSDHDDNNSEEDLKHPSPKRRRISISSDFGIHDPDLSQLKNEGEEEDLVMHDEAILSSLPDYEPLQYDEEADTAASTSPVLIRPPVSAPNHQPTFQKAPRFKPTEVPEGSYRGDPLPDAFSPHRKGAKYVPGGLAAEVRDWFVDVWASAGAGAVKRDTGEWMARIVADEVRGAPGMTLIVGRHISHEDIMMQSTRVILAGSPKITGLEKRKEVHPGAVVGVGKPTWEVDIPGQGRWGVVCEWTVL